jgi:hypothetical protein
MSEEKVVYKIKEELIVNNNMDIEEGNENNNDKVELTKEKNSLIMENIQNKLQTLDITQEKIENASKLILTEIYSHPQLLDNIILMIKEKIIYFNGNGIEFLYLISDILNRYKSDSKNKNININLIDVFYKELLEIIPFLSNILNLKLNEEINYIFNVWEKLEIFSKEQIDNLKFYKTLSLEPKLTGSKEENDILFDLITKGKYNLDTYLSEYSKEINILEESDEENKKKHRKNILKMTKDIINEQMKVYSNHIKYIKTLDSMLDKISTFKNYNKVLENNKI